MALSKPFPIEVALADGTVLRGIEHPADGPPLLFVHDVGEDLDAWGSVAPAVRAEGFRVICLELRGHGLSDGEPDPSATVDDVTSALAEVSGAFGPCGLVVHGTAAGAAFELGSEHGAPVHAVISPAPGPGDADDGNDGIGSVPSMRVLFTGAHDEPVHEHVRTSHSKYARPEHVDLHGHRAARTDPATGAPSPRGAAGDVHAPAPHRLPPRVDRRADR